MTTVACTAAHDPGLVFQNDAGYAESTSSNLAVLGLPDVTPTYSWIGVAPLSVPLALSRQFDASIVNDTSVPLHVYSVNATSATVSASLVDPTQCADVDLDPGAACSFTVGLYPGNEEVVGTPGTIDLSAVTSSLSDSVFHQPITVTDPLPQCSDGVDNDGDGYVDFDGGASANGGVAVAAPDPQCTEPYQNNEKAACGLGAELVLVLPALRWLGGRRRSRARR